MVFLKRFTYCPICSVMFILVCITSSMSFESNTILNDCTDKKMSFFFQDTIYFYETQYNQCKINNNRVKFRDRGPVFDKRSKVIYGPKWLRHLDGHKWLAIASRFILVFGPKRLRHLYGRNGRHSKLTSVHAACFR